MKPEIIVLQCMVEELSGCEFPFYESTIDDMQSSFLFGQTPYAESSFGWPKYKQAHEILIRNGYKRDSVSSDRSYITMVYILQGEL
jgi:hypothetical protein